MIFNSKIKLKMKFYEPNLKSNFGLVVESSSSPVADDQEAERPIGFHRVWETLKLSINRRIKKEKWKSNTENKRQDYGFITTVLITKYRSHGYVVLHVERKMREIKLINMMARVIVSDTTSSLTWNFWTEYNICIYIYIERVKEVNIQVWGI